MSLFVLGIPSRENGMLLAYCSLNTLVWVGSIVLRREAVPLFGTALGGRDV